MNCMLLVRECLLPLPADCGFPDCATTEAHGFHFVIKHAIEDAVIDFSGILLDRNGRSQNGWPRLHRPKHPLSKRKRAWRSARTVNGCRFTARCAGRFT